jgi:hypothetical protein
LHWSLGRKDGTAAALEGLATAIAGSRPDDAVRLLAAAARLRAAIGAPVPGHERGRHERGVAFSRSALGDDGFAAAWTTGDALPLDQTVALALSADPAPK